MEMDPLFADLFDTKVCTEAAPATTESRPPHDLDVEQLTQLLESLRKLPAAQLSAAASLISLATVIPDVFEKGEESVLSYLATKHSPVTATGLFKSLGGGFAATFSDDAVFAYCPGHPVFSATLNSFAHKSLLANLVLRLAVAGGPHYLVDPCELDGTLVTHSHLTSRKLDVADLAGSLDGLSNADTLDATGLNLVQQRYELLRDRLRGAFPGVILLPAGVGPVKLGSHTVSPGVALGPSYGRVAESASQVVRNWVWGLPSDVFSTQAAVKVVAPSVANITPEAFIPEGLAGSVPPGLRASFDHLIGTYAATHNWNNAMAHAYFGRASAKFKLLSNSKKRDAAKFVSNFSQRDVYEYLQAYVSSLFCEGVDELEDAEFGVYLLARISCLRVEHGIIMYD